MTIDYSVMFAAAESWADFFREEFADLGNGPLIARASIRLLMAAALGGILGFERGLSGKAAGPRTHMLVTMAGAIFVLAPTFAGFAISDISRVIQGMVAGIGFIGGGAILKTQSEKDVHGLTTAADIWLTSGIGVAVGLGRYSLAFLATVFALIILTVLRYLERKAGI